MTQKELLYLKDACEHEKHLISICTETVNMLEDEDLISFFEKEIKKHEKMQKEILEEMEECLDE